PRSLGVKRRQGPPSKARRAACTAWAISSPVLSGTRVSREASAGLSTSNSLPDRAATQRPSIRLRLGRASQAVTSRLAPREADGVGWPLPLPLWWTVARRERLSVRGEDFSREVMVFITDLGLQR